MTTTHSTLGRHWLRSLLMLLVLAHCLGLQAQQAQERRRCKTGFLLPEFSDAKIMQSFGRYVKAKANILMGLESTQARMSHMGSSMLLRGRVRTPDEIIAEYDAVTCEQVRQLAQEIFCFDRAALSAVGRVGSEEDYRAAISAFR